MLKALYYPHTEIRSETILKNALLLWDSIETIVPFRGWKPSRVHGDKLFREAVDLVVQPRVPTARERSAADAQLRWLIQTGFLPSVRIAIEEQRRVDRDFTTEYLIDPQKLLKKTWEALLEDRIVRWIAMAGDYGASPPVGFLLMSVLADVCAGTQIRKVTDWTAAYNWLGEMYAKSLKSQYITGLDPYQVAPSHDRLVTLSLQVLDGRTIPLKKLVQMRKREAKSGGSDYGAMRRRYLETLDACLKRIGQEAKSEADVYEIQRQFKNDLKQDVADLRVELGIAGNKALFSKEVGLSILLLAGSLASPIAGLTTLATTVGATGIIPLLKTRVDYRSARRDALKKHAMSWLFLAKQPRITLR